MPDSDDEAIVDELEPECLVKDSKRVQPKETNLQLWIKHLTLLLKAESRQVCASETTLDYFVCSWLLISMLQRRSA